MYRLISLLLITIVVAACSQFSNNAEERDALQAAADRKGDAYVDCAVQASLANLQGTALDVATAAKLAADTCATELADFRQAEEEALSARMMITDKPLQEAVDALTERVEKEVGAQVLAGNSGAVAPAAAAAVATATAVVQPPAPSQSQNADQRVYMDCMEDQATKYAGLNESAANIAEVAHSRCKSYATGAGSAVLIEDGKAMVMGAVMDARLEAQGGDAAPNN